MKLSPNFSLVEFTRSAKAQALGIDNTPPTKALENLKKTAAMLERIRSSFDGGRGLTFPIVVTSGYRSPELNKAIGSVSTSDHIQGMAADWISPSFGKPFQICKFLAPKIDLLGIGQLIYEAVRRKDGSLSEWIHASTRVPSSAANRVITITSVGTMLGIQEVE